MFLGDEKGYKLNLGFPIKQWSSFSVMFQDTMYLYFMFLFVYRKIMSRGSYFGECDFGSAGENRQLVSFDDQYAVHMEERYVAGNYVIAMEVSERDENWIDHEMGKPHVVLLKDRMEFTDAQIRNGLQILHRRGIII